MNSASKGFVGSFTGERAIPLAVDVRDMRLGLVGHPDQRGREARHLRRLGDDEGDRLAVEQDPAVVERPEGRAVGRDIVLVGLIVVRQGRAVLMGQDGDHARDLQRRGGVDSRRCVPW